MKKIALSLLLLTTFATLLQAQDDDKFFNLGVRATINGSWIGSLPQSTEDIEAQRDNLKVGYVVGIWGRINIVKGFYLQPELAISQNGGKYTYTFTPPVFDPSTVSKNITLTNFEFPLSLGFKFPLGPIGLRLSGGGILSTILSAKEKYDAVLAGESVVAEQDIKDKVNQLQTAVMGGIGLDLFDKLSIDVRLQQSLTELYESYNPVGNPDPLKIDSKEQKVISGSITLGFKLF
jgi:hypothetical protein